MTTRMAIVLVQMIFTAATRLNTPGPATPLYKESPIVTAINKIATKNIVIIFSSSSLRINLLCCDQVTSSYVREDHPFALENSKFWTPPAL